MIKSVFSAIAGLFLEPIRGGRERGFKGAMIGLGKGILGLVVKPVAGTLDLVTLTARGLANTPKTIYLKLSNVFKRKVRTPRGGVPIEPYLEQVSIEGW